MKKQLVSRQSGETRWLQRITKYLEIGKLSQRGSKSGGRGKEMLKMQDPPTIFMKTRQNVTNCHAGNAHVLNEERRDFALVRGEDGALLEVKKGKALKATQRETEARRASPGPGFTGARFCEEIVPISSWRVQVESTTNSLKRHPIASHGRSNSMTQRPSSYDIQQRKNARLSCVEFRIGRMECRLRLFLTDSRGFMEIDKHHKTIEYR